MKRYGVILGDLLRTRTISRGVGGHYLKRTCFLHTRCCCMLMHLCNNIPLHLTPCGPKRPASVTHTAIRRACTRVVSSYGGTISLLPTGSSCSSRGIKHTYGSTTLTVLTSVCLALTPGRARCCRRISSLYSRVAGLKCSLSSYGCRSGFSTLIGGKPRSLFRIRCSNGARCSF